MSLFGMGLASILTLAGILFIGLEAVSPGGHFIVLGGTLLVTGLVGLFIPALATPLALAVTTLVVGGSLILVYRHIDLYAGDGTGIRGTSDSKSLVGKTGRVLDRVTTDTGRVRLRDAGMNPEYMARTATESPIAEGTEIRVVDGGGGNVVTVEPVDTAGESAAESDT